VKYGLLFVFYNVRNVKLSDIHCQICKVYTENAMSDGLVRKCVRKFNQVRDNVHDELRSGWPAVFTGGHVL
jgi:hypothetical protein